MTITFILSSILILIGVIAVPKKHALKNECKYNNLQSGVYQCVLSDEKETFIVDCLVDGTMYINPGQQALYHYHKQSGLEMKFKSIILADYITIDDVIELKEGSMDDVNDWSITYKEEGEGTNDDDTTLNDDESLESEELTESEKQSVNLTAQYIVYAVIILMALIFSLGICLLIYWWCCHNTIDSNSMLHEKSNPNYMSTIDETAPFIDIRSPNTIKKSQLNGRIGKTVYFEENEEEILQRERNNIYDAINDTDDNEDGDDLIAHYGMTSNLNSNHSNNSNHGNDDNENAGYVIAKYPNND